MEYMEHGSLFDLLRNASFVLEGDSVLPLLRDISQGIRFFHSATPPVIHGDLKTRNILVDSKLRAKVADFGLSLHKDDVRGSYYWMAPELLRHEAKNNTATDVYAFGMILYEIYSRKVRVYVCLRVATLAHALSLFRLILLFPDHSLLCKGTV